MNLSINLNFNGNCEAAFQFYVECLNASKGFMLCYCDSPVADTVDSEWQHKILHGNIQIGETELSGTDVLPHQYKAPQGFFILLSFGTESEVNACFEALAEGGQTIMVPQKTFWSPCYAMVIDQFGVPWKLNCSRE